MELSAAEQEVKRQQIPRSTSSFLIIGCYVWYESIIGHPVRQWSRLGTVPQVSF